MNSNCCLFIILSIILFNNINFVFTLCPVSERNALDSFYQGTLYWYGAGLDSWNDLAIDCCDLKGVSCNDDGTSVIGIDASEFQIVRNNGESVDIDLTDLPNLLSLNLNNNNIVIDSLDFPNTLQSLELLYCDITNIPKSLFNLPSIQTLSISNFIESPFTLGFVAVNLTSLIVEDVDYTIDVTEIPNIERLEIYSSPDEDVLEVACTLTSLKQLSVGSNGGFVLEVIPSCILEKELVLLYLSGFTISGQFPTFNSSIQSLSLSNSNFDNIPDVLPESIKEFTCEQCFSNEVTIPESWINYTSLVYVDLSANSITEIPDYLISRLYYGDFSTNLVKMDIANFTKIRDGSIWDVSTNLIYGVIPDDFQYLFKDTIFIAGDNNLKGVLPRYAFCQDPFFDFTPTLDIELANHNNISNPNANIYLELYTIMDKFNRINVQYENYFCEVNFPDPGLPSYITPIPIGGGAITIRSDIYFYDFPPALLLDPLDNKDQSNKNNRKEKLDIKSIYNQRKEKFLKESQQLSQENQQSSYPQININVNGNTGINTAVGASGSYNNIPDYSYRFNSFNFFRENFGWFEIYQITTEQVYQTLACRMISWKDSVICENYPILDEPADYELRYWRSTGDDYAKQVIPSDLIMPINPPVINDVINVETEGDVSILGQFFGSEEQYLDATVDFTAPGLPDISCPVSFKNDSVIVCQKPRNDENSKVIYNLITKVGSQSADPIQIPYNQVEIPSDCFGDDDSLVCQGRGTCLNTDNLCHCDIGYQGIFCETKTSDVTPVTDTNVDENEPKSSFTHTEATSQFIVNIQEVRELDFHSTVVNRFTPTWSAVSSSGNKHVFESKLKGQSIIQATLQEFQDSQTISFANASITIDPGTVKYTISVSNYAFASSLNSMQVVFSLSANPSQEIQDKCAEALISNSNFNTDPNIADVKWVQLSRGNSKMTGRIINRSIIDSRTMLIQYQTEFVNNNTFNLVANIPHFETSAIIDPSYAALLNPDTESEIPEDSQCSGSNNNIKTNKWKIAVGVTIGVAAAVAIAIGGYILYKKKVVENDFKSKMKDLNNSNKPPPPPLG